MNIKLPKIGKFDLNFGSYSYLTIPCSFFSFASDREHQVLIEMASGKNNKTISEVLCIAESTVKFHINNLLTKLGASDRTSAVIMALKRGIIKL
ncbi:response regulator transcription factor [Pleurocapsales cyanobacterium LEGE 06147]|nr:response regulator transcription factor [Pleurocapsales cyanobacterium LEGE 06147]